MLAAIARHPVALWAGFVLVHFWLGMLGLYAPGLPLGDVTIVYHYWVQHGFDTGIWPGIDTMWVYPIGALAPMLAAWALGPQLYASTWLSLVMLVDAAGFAVLLAHDRHGRIPVASWWWLGFLVLLGPIAVGRIDAFTVPLALAGLLVVVRHPVVGTVLLTLAAWIKVWPAALVGAAFVAVRRRLEVLAAAVGTSGVVAITGLLLGAGGYLLSFVTQQAGRGLQIEAPVATPWMWRAALDGGARVHYDTAILTYQVQGDGVQIASDVTTPVLVLAALAILGLGAVAMRRGAPAGELLPVLALALTVALILFNKVGSPQFVSWLAVPIAAGLVAAARGAAGSFRVPAALGLLIALATQVFYPYSYGALLSLDPWMLVALTVRNLLYVVLLGWAIARLVGVIRSPREIGVPGAR